MAEKRAHSGKTFIIGIIILLGAAIWGLFRLNSSNSGICGETNEQRLAYIESFGWDAGIIHTDAEEIRIPSKFDEEYTKFNAIQKEQGFDLRKYRACTVTRYTYTIQNAENPDPVVPVIAELLVYEGKIIGASISSTEANGFVTVLAKN